MREIHKILVIEDQEQTTKAIQHALNETLPTLNASPDVVYVTNYTDAQARIASDEKYDLILLDHRMPRVDLGDLEKTNLFAYSANLENVGYNLLPDIRSHHPEARVIGTSSWAEIPSALLNQLDGRIDKLGLFDPEREFAPLLRRLLDN